MILLGTQKHWLNGARHLVSDTSTEELIAAAVAVGLQAKHIQISHHGLVHFDVWGRPLKRLLEAGVQVVSERELVERAIFV